MSLVEFWGVVKPILEFGIVGTLLIIVLKSHAKKESIIESIMQERLGDERSHKEEIVALERERQREMKELMHQYEESLAAVEKTLDSLSGHSR